MAKTEASGKFEPFKWRKATAAKAGAIKTGCAQSGFKAYKAKKEENKAKGRREAGRTRFCQVAAALLIAAAIIVCGSCIGHLSGKMLGVKPDMNTVALRIGHPKSDSDYDFEAAVDFLEDMFKRRGYKVLERAYAGDLYPKRLDSAGINVFVRGFPVFFDLRMRKEGINIYYLHRFSQFYQEELRHFDRYLTSQQKLIEATKNVVKADFLSGGYVFHDDYDDLSRTYVYDVLYIYEFYNEAYDVFIQRYKKPKVYSGTEFAQLSLAERAEELNRARLVVYEMGEPGLDDGDYVPYAVFDILSYGRPLVTNRKPALLAYFNQTVKQFDGFDEMCLATKEAYALGDKERERRAKEARAVLYQHFQAKNFFLDKR